jgi:hypothetical protein
MRRVLGREPTRAASVQARVPWPRRSSSTISSRVCASSSSTVMVTTVLLLRTWAGSRLPVPMASPQPWEAAGDRCSFAHSSLSHGRRRSGQLRGSQRPSPPTQVVRPSAIENSLPPSASTNNAIPYGVYSCHVRVTRHTSRMAAHMAIDPPPGAQTEARHCAACGMRTLGIWRDPGRPSVGRAGRLAVDVRRPAHARRAGRRALGLCHPHRTLGA